MDLQLRRCGKSVASEVASVHISTAVTTELFLGELSRIFQETKPKSNETDRPQQYNFYGRYVRWYFKSVSWKILELSFLEDPGALLLSS
jgi:hypothetical protein